MKPLRMHFPAVICLAFSVEMLPTPFRVVSDDSPGISFVERSSMRGAVRFCTFDSRCLRRPNSSDPKEELSRLHVHPRLLLSHHSPDKFRGHRAVAWTLTGGSLSVVATHLQWHDGIL